MKDDALSAAFQQSNVVVDDRGYVSVDGVRLCRRVRRSDGTVCVQVCDKDRRRSGQRGSRLIEAPLHVVVRAILAPETWPESSFSSDGQ